MSTETKTKKELLTGLLDEVDKIYKNAANDVMRLDLLKFKRDVIELLYPRKF